MVRHINRRQFATGMGLVPLLTAGRVAAQETTAGQFLIASKRQSKLLGADAPPTEHWYFKTNSDRPIIRAKQGQELHLRVSNELDEVIWLHFFGIRGPTDMMTVEVPAGSGNAVDVVFTPPDAGTFWFGPLLNASKHREMGLTGMLIVDEVTSSGFNEVAMIIDDWSLDDAGIIDADFSNLNRAAGEGRLGNWFTVNDELTPRIRIEADKPTRLRLLNVANTRNMNVAFKGAEVLIIARDGQPVLPVPLGVEALHLQPGQRADVLLSDAQAQVVIALDLFEDVVEAAFLDAADYGNKPVPPSFALSSNPLPIAGADTAPRQVDIALEGGIKGGLVSAKVGKDVLELRAMLEQGLAWSIAGSSGLGSPAMFDAQYGELIQLNFDNRTAFEQPLHIHGHVWQTSTYHDAAFIGPSMPLVWSDTLVIPAKTKQTVVLVAANPGAWAIQSLLAERCDAGLIGSFIVADMP